MGSQEGTSSEVLNATALQQFGVPIGYRYGFCFVSYPTYIPGLDQGSVGTNKWTRCIPSSRADASKKKGVNGTTSFTQGIALIANSGVSGVQKTTEDNKLASLDTALSAVAKSMAGPRESLMSLVEQLRKYKWVILGCCGEFAHTMHEDVVRRKSLPSCQSASRHGFARIPLSDKYDILFCST